MVPVHMLRLPLGVQLIISASAEYQTHVLLPRANDTRRTHLVVLALIWSEVCWERMSCFEPLVSAPSLKISAVAASHSLQETAHGADVRRVRPSRVLPGPQPTLVMLAANDVFEPIRDIQAGNWKVVARECRGRRGPKTAVRSAHMRHDLIKVA